MEMLGPADLANNWPFNAGPSARESILPIRALRFVDTPVCFSFGRRSSSAFSGWFGHHLLPTGKANCSQREAWSASAFRPGKGGYQSQGIEESGEGIFHPFCFSMIPRCSFFFSLGFASFLPLGRSSLADSS
jgi:hypothetical protein